MALLRGFSNTLRLEMICAGGDGACFTDIFATPLEIAFTGDLAKAEREGAGAAVDLLATFFSALGDCLLGDLTNAEREGAADFLGDCLLGDFRNAEREGTAAAGLLAAFFSALGDCLGDLAFDSFFFSAAAASAQLS